MSNVARSTACRRLLSYWFTILRHNNVNNPIAKSSELHLQRLPFVRYAQYRGVKTKATVTLDDVPQRSSLLERGTSQAEDDGTAYPKVVQQALNNMRKHDNCVVLTRVGSFYEVC